jgi:hypothetical protein
MVMAIGRAFYVVVENTMYLAIVIDSSLSIGCKNAL